jgi:thioester reductase-like protein
MAVFVTGATGYLGSYVVAGLLARHHDQLNVLVRAKHAQEARERLWRSLQLHLDSAAFCNCLHSRVRIFCGDLTQGRFGLCDDDYHELVDTTDSVIHCAASLNRKSEKQCLNVNLRGTLEVIQLARCAQNRAGLRRFSHVSTVAVAGRRRDTVVTEDASIDWTLSDYDPYARTKKFCEHMLRQLLPDVPRTIFRPSIVLGDSRKPETTQFEMVRAFDFLAGLPVLPLRPEDRIDIVPADYVGRAIVAIHQKDDVAHDIYHVSSGQSSETYRQLTTALAQAAGWRAPNYLPWLERPFGSMIGWLARRRGKVGHGASLMKVFWPYLTWNTVFDNSRVLAELGEAPVPFSRYAYSLLVFSRKHRFVYPAKPWPAEQLPDPAPAARRAGA